MMKKQTSTQDIDVEKGQQAFKQLYEKLKGLEQIPRVDFPKIIGDNAWHISTILNTFNRYYCYDANAECLRGITPIFLNVQYRSKSSISRLLSVVVHIDKNNTKNNTIYFYFDRPLDTDGKPLIVRTLGDLGQQIVRDEALFYDVNYETVRDHYFGNDTSQWPIDYSRYIRYTMLANGGKLTYVLPPVYGDLYAINNMDFLENKRVVYKDINGSPFEWYVNFAYVARNRMANKDGDDTKRAPIAIFPQLTPKARRCFLRYLFGADIDFIEENFLGQVVYKKKTHIHWDFDAQKELAPLVSFDMLHLVTKEYVDTNLLTEHNEDNAVASMKRIIIDNHRSLLAWEEDIQYICMKIGQMARDISYNPPLTTASSKLLAFNGGTLTTEEEGEEEKEVLIKPLTLDEDALLEEMYAQRFPETGIPYQEGAEDEEALTVNKLEVLGDEQLQRIGSYEKECDIINVKVLEILAI